MTRSAREHGNVLIMRSGPPAVALLLLITSCVSSVQVRQTPLAPSQPQPIVSSEADAIPRVQLRGTPTELGTQHGIALHDSIVQLHDQYLMKFISTGPKRMAAMAAATLFEKLTPEDYRQEIAALAEATHLPGRDVMLAQCFLDLLPATACSLVTLPGDASADGVPRFGRNLDFFSLGIADKSAVLLVYHPAGKYAFAAVSWPGMIGVLSGMNEHGLSVASAEVPRPLRWPDAMPYTLLYRMILERCRTVDEAVDLLQRTPRQSANNLMLMDGSGQRAVAEISPDGVVLRRAPPNQPLTCTNTHLGTSTLPSSFPSQGSSGRRYDTLQNGSAAMFGDLSVMAIESLLRQADQGDFTLQSMIFEPTRRTLYLSVGKEATTRPYVRYDIGQLIKLR